MALNNLKDLYLHTLKDIYYAEKKIHQSLPKMINHSYNSKLKKLFEDHKKETENQIERLEKVFSILGEKASGEKCPAIEGIITEAEELIEEIDDAETCDAALIAAGQAVEHYEITRYGTLIAWSKTLGYDDAISLLQDNLDEECAADKKLTQSAENSINKKAA
jgi:ferritin-like metal-binding protein YciE